MLRIPIAIAALIVGAPSALAQCSMPAVLKARACEAPEVAALERQLVVKEAEVQAASAQPATWRWSGVTFRAWLAREKDYEGKPVDSAFIAQQIKDRIKGIDYEIAASKSFLPVPDAATAIGDKCLSSWLAIECTVPASGIIRAGGTRIVWQVVNGATEEDGSAAGILLWDASATGAPKLVGWTFEGVQYEMPQLSEEGGLLWAAGIRSGTGEGNADILLQKRGEKWAEIDMTSWRESFRPRMPGKLDIWKGVKFYFSGPAMGAEAELWKPDDANCCPTGGRANLEFAIEDDRLVLKGISAQIGGSNGAWKDF